ncbi:MAG: MMPL family transporter [Granulosicoccus sp.]|nr:MMPL family transporter [Granulosicoccus sp.]
MLVAYSNYIIKNCRLVVGTCVLLVLLATTGVAKLGFTNEYRAFFSKENPELLAFEEIQKTFSRSDNILIMIIPRSGDVFEPVTLQAILDITEESWKIPFVRRVDSLSNFQHSYGTEDDLVIEDLITSVDDIDLSELRSTALTEPLLINRLISPNSDATAINLTVNLKSEFDTPVVVDAVRTMISELKKQYPDLQFYESGILMLNDALSDATINDIITLIPIVYIVVSLGVAFFVRSLYLTLVTVALVTLSICAAMGIAGWMGIVLTPPSASVPPIIMTLAVADCLHLFISFQQKYRENLSQRDAITASIDLNLSPVFLTSLTTTLGFLSLNFSDAPPFRDLGNMTAIGVLCAFLLSMTFLPAMLALRDLKKPTHLPTLGAHMERFASYVITNRKGLLWAGLIIAVGFSALIPRNELNDNFVEYFDTSIKFRTDTDLITERLTGIYFVEFSLDTGSADGITDPDYLRKLALFEDWLDLQPEVVHVNSILEIIRRLNFNLHGNDRAFYNIPDSKEEIAQYLLLFEMSLPNGLDLNSQISVDKAASRVTVSLETLSTSEMLAFEAKVQAWMSDNIPTLGSPGVSPSMMFSHISVRNIKSMLIGTAVALVLISLLLIFPLRSIRHGALSLVSNMLPACIAFGIWSLLVGKISLGVSVVIAMTLGIVVDDTIHLISKYLRARRELNLDPADAIRYSFSTVGVALLATTFALTAGFAVLATSSFQVNSHLSIVSAITIVVALIVDLLLIPPILLLMDNYKNEKT